MHFSKIQHDIDFIHEELNLLSGVKSINKSDLSVELPCTTSDLLSDSSSIPLNELMMKNINSLRQVLSRLPDVIIRGFENHFANRIRIVLKAKDLKKTCEIKNHSDLVKKLNVIFIQTVKSAIEFSNHLSQVGFFAASINILSQETHQSGKFPILVKLKNGVSWIYHPRSILFECSFQRYLSDLNEKSGTSTFHPLKYIQGKTYGWIESEVRTPSGEARDFDFRFGALLAVVYALAGNKLTVEGSKNKTGIPILRSIDHLMVAQKIDSHSKMENINSIYLNFNSSKSPILNSKYLNFISSRNRLKKWPFFSESSKLVLREFSSSSYFLAGFEWAYLLQMNHAQEIIVSEAWKSMAEASLSLNSTNLCQNKWTLGKDRSKEVLIQKMSRQDLLYQSWILKLQMECLEVNQGSSVSPDFEGPPAIMSIADIIERVIVLSNSQKFEIASLWDVRRSKKIFFIDQIRSEEISSRFLKWITVQYKNSKVKNLISELSTWLDDFYLCLPARLRSQNLDLKFEAKKMSKYPDISLSGLSGLLLSAIKNQQAHWALHFEAQIWSHLKSGEYCFGDHFKSDRLSAKKGWAGILYALLMAQEL